MIDYISSLLLLFDSIHLLSLSIFQIQVLQSQSNSTLQTKSFYLVVHEKLGSIAASVIVSTLEDMANDNSSPLITQFDLESIEESNSTFSFPNVTGGSTTGFATTGKI